MKEATLETRLEIKSEEIIDVIEIYRFDKNDYEIYFCNQDCSVRGTLLDILQELAECGFSADQMEEVVE